MVNGYTFRCSSLLTPNLECRIPRRMAHDFSMHRKKSRRHRVPHTGAQRARQWCVNGISSAGSHVQDPVSLDDEIHTLFVFPASGVRVPMAAMSSKKKKKKKEKKKTRGLEMSFCER